MNVVWHKIITELIHLKSPVQLKVNDFLVGFIDQQIDPESFYAAAYGKSNPNFEEDGIEEGEKFKMQEPYFNLAKLMKTHFETSLDLLILRFQHVIDSYLAILQGQMSNPGVSIGNLKE